MPTNRNRLFALALAAVSVTAFAQNTTTTPNSTVGVTPSEAREAMKEAVPRSDTATVTRTDESAADKARRAANATADAVTPGRDRDTSSATGSTSSTTGAGTAPTTRPARADRH